MVKVLDEVRARIQRHRSDAALAGVQLHPPLLVLGTSERVGSNWLSDTLGAWWQQHNEPFRQQLDASHPLSSANPAPASWHDLTGADLGPLGRHWLVTFAVGKYGITRQVIKETNLFFATTNLLRLFPDAPLVIASRSPLGVISSFTRNGLFTTWVYQERYRQLAAAAAQPATKRWSVLLPDDDPDQVTALTRLIVANSLLLAEAVDDQPTVHVPYERAVMDRAGTLRAIGDLTGSYLKPPQAYEGSAWAGADDTFATTNPKCGLVAHLPPGTAEQIRATVAALLDTARDVVSGPVLARAATWLAGDHCYRLTPTPKRTRPATAAPAQTVEPKFTWVREAAGQWRNMPVTNDEFAAFLNALAAAGLANTRQGTHLLAVAMPAGRGGRLHHDDHGRWAAQPGYGTHPVYWVTWLGAATFAAHAGARLPTRAECDTLTADAPLRQANAGYRHGDVTSVIEPGHGDDQIHHRVGNVQVWCADGPHPVQLPAGPLVRWLHGTAWNTPASTEQIHRPRHRHLLGASRGVGIRLIRHGHHRPVPAEHLAALLHDWIRDLADRDRPLTELDAPAVAALARLQPDVGLRPHVGTGAGEP